jgi:uncharacterized protein (TIGR02996 family)
MSDEAAFLSAILETPADELPRLVFADWLDDRDDLRGAYLRAECKWVKRRVRAKRSLSPKLRRLAAPLDPVWVARVSRPPMGVCFHAQMLRCAGKPATVEEVDELATEFDVIFPPEYRALLLDHNGLSTELPDQNVEECEVLDSAKGVAKGAHRLFKGGHESNRRCGLFPIGCDVQGANSRNILLGVAYPNTPPGRYFGCVFYGGSEESQWLDEAGAFIEEDNWGYQKAADSLCELIANWDHWASR